MTAMIELLAVLTLTVGGFLVLLDRKDARASVERGRALDQLTEERAQHRRELQVLIQRIHAPEIAVVRHDAEQAQTEPAGGAPPVLDEDFWAEHQQAAEYVAQQEALENAPFDRA